jgi:pyruvate formate lyase activating enzyme
MEEAPWQALAPEEAAALSLQYAPRGNIGLAYTYNEPLIGYEFVRACAELVQGQKQENVLVTNGLIRPEPLKALLPLISAMNIDLKGFTPQFYRDIGGQLEAVQATIAAAAQACHVEVTTLIIPGQNDSPQEMDAMAAWLKGISPGIPLHITRFFPRYKMRDSLPTPPETLRRLAEIAGRHLRHVHLGNL